MRKIFNYVSGFALAMTTLIVIFFAFVGYLIVSEVNADADFKRRCTQLEGFMASQDGDQQRICVDRDRRIILQER